MGSLEAVRRFFPRESDRDARDELVCNALGGSARTLLHVGCGAGRHTLELARRGAERAVGLDARAEKIRDARLAAEEAGLASRCAWEVGDLLSFPSDEIFDASIALGYFDHLDAPLPHLQRLAALTRGAIWASFPRRWTALAPLRKLRTTLDAGYVRFYSRGDVIDLFAAAGAIERTSILELGEDFLAVCNPVPTAATIASFATSSAATARSPHGAN